MYKKRTPFHPKRLHDFLAEHFVFYEVSQASGESSEEGSADPEKTLEQRRARAAKNSSTVVPARNVKLADSDEDQD